MKNIFSFLLLLICFQVSGQIQTINVGTAANAGNGDNLRAAFTKVNSNFTYVNLQAVERLDSLIDATAESEGVQWGDITGTLTDQTDLNTALAGKVPTTRTINSQPLSGDITLTKSNIGLSNVDNTSDASKPISTLTQTALDLKANSASPTFTGTVVLPSTTSIGTITNTELSYVDGVTSSIQTQIGTKANSASPTFTGTVVLPSTTSIGNVTNTEIGYVDGVTSSIQSQFDIRRRIIHKDNNVSSSVTGTLTETVLASYLIPAGTLQANDVLVLRCVSAKSGTAGAYTVRFRANATPVVAGSTLLGTSGPSATTLTSIMQRDIIFKNSLASQECFPANVNANSDLSTSTSALSMLTVDFSVDQYIIIGLVLSNIADTGSIRSWYIEVIR
jgi:hypothetical protein